MPWRRVGGPGGEVERMSGDYRFVVWFYVWMPVGKPLDFCFFYVSNGWR